MITIHHRFFVRTVRTHWWSIYRLRLEASGVKKETASLCRQPDLADSRPTTLLLAL